MDPVKLKNVNEPKKAETMMKRAAVVLFFLLMVLPCVATAQIDMSEYSARRHSAMEKCPDGIVLLHAVSGFKHWDEFGLHQDANFYYFTGLENALGAVLAMDGTTKESWLFVPKQLRGMVSMGAADRGIKSAYLAPGEQTQAALKIEHVVPWDGLIEFIDGRRASNPKLVIYADSGGQTGNMMGMVSNPQGLAPIENPHLLWLNAIQTHWPDLQVKDAFPILDEVRAVKSPAEIALMRKAAALTADGFWAGARAIALGKTERQVEAAVVNACMQSGSEGPSLWPWIKSGPNAVGAKVFEAFADYRNGNRTMKAGELVRVDVGCDYEMYKGDFGRTIPVSGRFDEGQAETLELLNGAYMAGLKVMKEGATAQDIVKASIGYVDQHKDNLKTEMAKQAAANAIKNGEWPLHGLGVDMADGFPRVLHAGNVICFEPRFAAGDQAVFVEDTILITRDGYEILNPALPYSAKDIERAIANKGGSPR
jgi:Xaa-Pro aminopeptidase